MRRAMVRADRSDFIQDSKRDAVLPWRAVYTIVKRDGTNGAAWVALGISQRLSPRRIVSHAKRSKNSLTIRVCRGNAVSTGP